MYVQYYIRTALQAFLLYRPIAIFHSLGSSILAISVADIDWTSSHVERISM